MKTREESLIEAVSKRLAALGQRPALHLFAKTQEERNRRMALIDAWTAGKAHIGADALRTMRSFQTPTAAAMVARWQTLVAENISAGVPAHKAWSAVVDDCCDRVTTMQKYGTLGPA